MVLWTPPSINYLPPDLKPPGFKHYKFSDDGPLSLPMGGITYDGLVYIRGTRTMASEDIPTRACIVKGGRARKHHIVETQDLPPSDSSSLGVTPMCCQSNGHSVRRWQRVVQEELPLMICTKAEWGNGGLWCYPCIEALRAKIVPLGLKGRATHISLFPFPDEAVNVPGAPDSVKDSVLLTFTTDDKSYKHPNYGYCNQCRQSWHEERDDAPCTDWTTRLVIDASRLDPC